MSLPDPEPVRDALRRVLFARFRTPLGHDLLEAIARQGDQHELLRWVEVAAVCLSLDEFRASVRLGAAPRPPVPDDSWLPACFYENQKKVDPEDMRPYAGQHIAWSWDGSRVLASDADLATLFDKVVQAGHDPHRVVYAYIDDL